MNREEILEKSRRENKNLDIVEKEAIKDSAGLASFIAGIFATVFFIIQVLLGGGVNYGLYAVAFSIPSTVFAVKAVRLRRRHEIVIAGFYAICTLTLSAAHIYRLVAA